VVACGDPDKRVNGAGLARLRAAGIAVSDGVLAAEAETLQAGFLTRVRLGRPLITLKLATTLDGRIATRTGESQWITGPEARRAAHALRGVHDAVLAGVGTVLADDPALTCRIPGYRRQQPVRIVLDRSLRTPLTATVAATASETPTWIVHRPEADPVRQAALAAAAVKLVAVAPDELADDGLAGVLQALGNAGLTRVLVEGGARVAASLLRDDLVDGIAWFHAPGVIGGDGLAAAQAFGVAALAGMPRFRRLSVRPLGPDLLSEFERTDFR
jgi:diaminohydroxyphosphoribosylaminopyrimidine deaminase/5-amino-6-(5-phosphoribosylamino)uracil reductase